jgi:hypothetical protein
MTRIELTMEEKQDLDPEGFWYHLDDTVALIGDVNLEEPCNCMFDLSVNEHIITRYALFCELPKSIQKRMIGE